jgi:hypothetical protein
LAKIPPLATAASVVTITIHHHHWQRHDTISAVIGRRHSAARYTFTFSSSKSLVHKINAIISIYRIIINYSTSKYAAFA